MDDNRAPAEEVWDRGLWRMMKEEAILVLAAYGEARYKAGVEAGAQKTKRFEAEARYYAEDKRKAEQRIKELEGLVRELREAGQKAAEGGKAAADELMYEGISKTRAANWGVINQGLLACDALLRLLPHADAALAGEPGEGGERSYNSAEIRRAYVAGRMSTGCSAESDAWIAAIDYCPEKPQEGKP
jgi:hypothetical protein